MIFWSDHELVLYVNVDSSKTLSKTAFLFHNFATKVVCTVTKLNKMKNVADKCKTNENTLFFKQQCDLSKFNSFEFHYSSLCITCFKRPIIHENNKLLKKDAWKGLVYMVMITLHAKFTSFKEEIHRYLSVIIV